MSIALQLLINILIPTALFGLVAAGFSVFYAVSRVQHLAIGASVSVAGYLFFALASAGMSLPLAGVAAIAASVAAGYLCNALIYERLQGRRWFSSLVALVSSVMLLLIFQSLLLIFFGSQPKAVPLPAAGRVFEIGGASLTLIQAIVIPLGFALLSAFALYLKYSKLGMAIRATADNSESAEVLGINTRKIRYLTMLLVSGIAGVAGIFIALEFNLEPYASNMHAIRAFGRTIVGGTGSIAGVLLSGFLIDTAEQAGGYFATSTYKELYSFLIVFLFLLFRPQGILGAKRD